MKKKTKHIDYNKIDYTKVDYKTFKKKYMVRNLLNMHGKPKHTRYLKKFFERFAKELLEEFGLDVHHCAHCGIGEEWNGKKLVLQMEHKNAVINDSRASNIEYLCANCHSQTPTFCRRKS